MDGSGGICASSGEGSLLNRYTWTVNIEEAAIGSRPPWVRGACISNDRGMETAEV